MCVRTGIHIEIDIEIDVRGRNRLCLQYKNKSINENYIWNRYTREDAPAPLQANTPSVHVCSASFPHFWNHEPPEAQQLRSPLFANVPHVGHSATVSAISVDASNLCTFGRNFYRYKNAVKNIMWPFWRLQYLRYLYFHKPECPPSTCARRQHRLLYHTFRTTNRQFHNNCADRCLKSYHILRKLFRPLLFLENDCWQLRVTLLHFAHAIKRSARFHTSRVHLK